MSKSPVRRVKENADSSDNADENAAAGGASGQGFAASAYSQQGANMLIFSDIAKFIRFFRVETDDEGKITRIPLGRVSKMTLEIDQPLADQLQGDERAEVERVVAGYREAEIQRKRSNALALPVILREAMEHLETEATETEKAFILGAVVEAVRRMRKFQREA
jgi:hypothetical protein